VYKQTSKPHQGGEEREERGALSEEGSVVRSGRRKYLERTSESASVAVVS
jgi:hypothetical protein